MADLPFDKVEVPENDLFAEWLGETRFITQLIVDVTDCLALLATKRTTLEEKMIRQELHSLVSAYGGIIAVVHSQLPKGIEPEWFLLERLRWLNFAVREEMGKFLKALRYNFNYVEQYFEFDFCTRLREECAFSQEALEILNVLRGN